MLTLRLCACWLLLSACGSAFESDDRYRCGSDADCLGTHTCHPTLFECVREIGPGQVTVFGVGREVLLVEAVADGRVEVLTPQLDVLEPEGQDDWAVRSPNGRRLLVSTDRFGCVDPCLVTMDADLGARELVRIDNQQVRSNTHGAISNDGGLIVFREDTPPFSLFAARRGAQQFEGLVELTAGATLQGSSAPVLAADGARVVFECGGDDDPSICAARTDGSGFEVLVRGADRGEGGQVSRPSFAPDGSVVFVADWDEGSHLWRLPADRGPPQRVGFEVQDVLAACVLPSGAIAWLEDPGTDLEGPFDIRLSSASGEGTTLVADAIKAHRWIVCSN